MNQDAFVYDARYKEYRAEIDGFVIEIGEQDWDAAAVALAGEVVAVYARRLPAIAAHMAANEDFAIFYDEPGPDEIMAKLNLPVISLGAAGGRLTYCKHLLDDDHIIDLDFSGALAKFYDIEING